MCECGGQIEPQLRLLGHVARMEETLIPKCMLTCKPERSVGG